MRGFFIIAALVALFPGIVQGAEPEGTVEKLDSAVVSVSRAGNTTPVTYTMVSRDELRTANPMHSLPMSLALQPSVVSVNEGGTGLGYSKMTVRGIKGSQINVTLNGITLNDAESQEVFWVNIPALSGILSSVQLQRGLGTSASGPGAFGASLNLSTASVGANQYASADFGYGSYDTFTATAAAGTGLTRSGLYFDFAYSRGLTDGYIRNAFADVQSAFAVLGWMNERNSLRLTWLFGDQHTGITWHGIDLSQYEADRRYNPAGEYYDQYGNVRYYDNDTDNYTQHHLQLNYTRLFAERFVWTTTFNWTKGDGYYENYKAGKRFSKYNFIFDEDPEGDFIVREAMDNHYFVLNSDLRYSSERLAVTAGVNLSRYDGDHIGKVLWNDVLGDDYDYSSHKWYLNNGLKQEANAFVRAEWAPLNWMTTYADMQYRGVWLDMSGPEDDQIPLDYSCQWQFLNPRAGISFHWD
ncbi:MAG: TonB-dependent receptor plug domain-containing protein, partial [Bacteroidales bacterium]|nr:TonB-dependent receptor plug domain-containing protein [Bacteroidales bacterium]